jgi:hypothetical protein
LLTAALDLRRHATTTAASTMVNLLIFIFCMRVDSFDSQVYT